MKRSALVVDDSDPVRGLVASILEAKGYTVYEAATSQQAIQLLVSAEIALIVSDLHLGGRASGLGLLEEAVKLRPRVKCVLMTGSIVPGQKLPTAIPLLAKPFTPATLLDLADSLLTECG